MFDFNYAIFAESKDFTATYQMNSLEEALEVYTQAYQSELFDNVRLADGKTGEILAYYEANPLELWQSDELKLTIFFLRIAQSLEDVE